MITLFSNNFYSTQGAETDLNCSIDLSAEIEKTCLALEAAYAGFNYATEEEVIDCYIYKINSLLKRYSHLEHLQKKICT